MVGSITKSMTATAAATVVERGHLAWDDSVLDHLPGFAVAPPGVAEAVELQHLLSHTSGVAPRYLPFLLNQGGSDARLEDVATSAVLGAPGEVFEFNNDAFTLAGPVIARASGARRAHGGLDHAFSRLMRHRLFRPAGMFRTTLSMHRATRRNHAHPHAFHPLFRAVRPVPLEVEGFVSTVAPAGAAWSSIRDMARYALLHLGAGTMPEGRYVVSEELLRQTYADQFVLPDGRRYALGWFISDVQGVKTISHGGASAGFTADITLAPELGSGLVVLTNRSFAGPLIKAVSRFVQERALGQPAAGHEDLLAEEQALRGRLASLAELVVPVEAGAVAEHLGRYEGDLSVFHDGDALVLRTRRGDVRMLGLIGSPGAFIAVENLALGLVVRLVESEAGPAIQVGQIDPALGAPRQTVTFMKDLP